MAEEFTKIGSDKRRRKASGDTSWSNFGRALGQGATFGFQDEIAGGLAKARGEDYTDARDQERAEYEAYVENHPFRAFAGEALGGFAPAVAAALTGAGAGGTAAYLARLGALGNRGLQMAALANRAKQPVRLAAAGAGYGALSGAGAAKEMSDIPLEAAKGAGIGAVAAPVISKGLEKSSKLLTNQARNYFPQAFAKAGAERRVLADIGESGESITSLHQKMLADEAMGHNPRLWNMSPVLQQRALGIAINPSEGMRRLQGNAWQNQYGAKGNVVNRINQDLASINGQAINPALRKAELETVHKSQAKDLYGAYRKMKLADIKGQKLEDMLQLEPIKKMLMAADDEMIALRNAANPGEEIAPLFVKDASGKIVRNSDAPLTPDHMEYIKKALNAQVTAGYKSSDPSVVQKAEDWKKLRDVWRDETVKATTNEKGVSLAGEARKAFGEGKNIEEAIKYGQETLRSADPTELQMKMYGTKGKSYTGGDRPYAVESDIIGSTPGMTAAEREALKLGYVQKIRDTLLNKKQNVNAYGEVLAPNEQDRIRLLMKTDPEKAEQLIKYLTRGQELYGQSANITSGSKTAHALAARESLKEDISLGDVLASTAQEAANIANSPATGSAGFAKKALGTILPDSSNYNKEVENKVADILLKSQPEMRAFIDAGKRRQTIDTNISNAGNAANLLGTAGAAGSIRQYILDPTGYVDKESPKYQGNSSNSEWVLK